MTSYITQNSLLLYNFIDGDIGDLSWQDIISNYDDKDIDHQNINEPINLYGIYIILLKLYII